jgi:MFS transporter, ACS family, tartrate transporter
MRRVAWRLLPLLIAGYFVAFVDRVNVGFAALQMNHDLGLSPAVFGLGSGLFFLSYAVFEVPSNLLLKRVGARLWLARIMISWGLLAAAMALVVGPKSFNALRLLLGAAEAGFFPGVIVYLTYWFPRAYRARVVAIFMVAIPLSSFLGSPISALLLQADGALGLRGWQWLFIVEAVPAVLLGVAALVVLTDRPERATWLNAAQRDWLAARLAEEQAPQSAVGSAAALGGGLWALMSDRRVLLAALLCAGSAGVSQCLAIWQPQFLKSFGLTNWQTGLANAVPYGIASLLMIVWGRRSDRLRERYWHSLLPLSLVAAALFAALLTHSFWPTLLLLCLVLTATYAFKGPFWAMSTEWLTHESAAAGIAYINAIGAVAAFAGTTVLGIIRAHGGSYAQGLLPLATLCALGVVALWQYPRQATPGGLRQRT